MNVSLRVGFLIPNPDLGFMLLGNGGQRIDRIH